MKIAILGIGRVGGFYSEKPACRFENDREIELIFIARGNHLDAIQKNGLKTEAEIIFVP